MKQLQSTADDETETVYWAMLQAIQARDLLPGTKLSEETIGASFGISRPVVRGALNRLSTDQLVVFERNRGAFVASPTAEQARSVFEARLAIEPAIARLAVTRADSADIAALKTHLDKEMAAHVAGNRHDAIRHSGQFHVMLAQVADNNIMLRMVRELVARTSLIIGIFAAPGVSNCRDDEHAKIVAAFEDRDEALAAALMAEHLLHIQSHLDLSARHTTPVDLVRLFNDR